MFGRFFIPIVPLLFLLMEYLILRIFTQKKIRATFLVITFSVLAFYDPYKGKSIPIIDGVSDENQIYKLSSLQHAIRTISPWKNFFKQNSIRVAIGGAQAYYAYYLEPELAIESMTGLTDEYLAHRKLEQRGELMGHEKSAPIDYLTKRGVHFHLSPQNIPGKNNYNTITIQGLPDEWRILIYKTDIMREMAKIREFQFIDFENYLDQYILKMKEMPERKIHKDYKEFRSYYFQHNFDPKRESHFKKFSTEPVPI